MALIVRQMRRGEGRTFLEIHRSAVWQLARSDYSREVLETWAPVPVTDEAAAAVERNTESEIRVIADLDNVAVGIGVLAPDALELRACYVRPDTVRRGIGTAIVRELERIAIGFGSTSLHLHASLNAVQFYRSLGYEITGPCQHVFRSGERMAACAMRRGLTAVRG